MQDEYIEFKRIGHGRELTLRKNDADLTIDQLAELFQEFALAMGYSPTSVEELFS